MTFEIREKVFQNLDSAQKNEYFKSGEQLDGATVEEIALDMIAYADDCSEYQADELIPYINEWLETHNANRNSQMP